MTATRPCSQSHLWLRLEQLRYELLHLTRMLGRQLERNTVVNTRCEPRARTDSTVEKMKNGSETPPISCWSYIRTTSNTKNLDKQTVDIIAEI